MAVADVDVQVTWSEEDEAFVATSPLFPSLSWLDSVSAEGAREGFLGLVARISAEDADEGEGAGDGSVAEVEPVPAPEAKESPAKAGGHGEGPSALPYILGVLFLVFATIAGIQEFGGDHDRSSVKSGVHIDDPMVTPSGTGH